jgi:hypothetical protein
VTARGEVTSVPRVSAGLLVEGGCGTYSRRVDSLRPRLIKYRALILAAGGGNRRESMGFHVYADMYFKHRYRPRPDRARVLRYFRFTMENATPRRHRAGGSR